MGKQVGFAALARHIKEEAPFWATAVPQLPRLIHHALSTPDRIEAARRDMARLAQAQRRQSLALTVVGALLTALLALELWRLVGS
jgi:ubiquinone biosynthesis protein